MSAAMDQELIWLVAGVLAVLIVGSVIGVILGRRATSEAARATVANLNDRIRAWWVMAAVLAMAVLLRGPGSVLLFALISFLALREFITLTPTGHGDHRTLLWVFFIVMPIQY
jgi:phosphatidate cytidylyltransferase